MQQAIIYTRFSTLEQKDGVSLERQLERCHELASEMGLEVEKIVSDSGKSAFFGKHRLNGAGLAALEKEVVAGHHIGKVLLIEKISRLSREDPSDSNDLMRALTRNGVTVASHEKRRVYRAYENPDFLTLIEYFLMAKMVHEESVAKQDFSNFNWRVRRERIAAGEIVTELCPAWLVPAEDRSRWLIIGAGKGPVHDRGEIIRRIFQMADDGLGSEQIAKRLNADRIPPWPRFSGEQRKAATAWSRGFVLRIMQNVAVIGDCQMMKFDDDRRRVPVGDPVRGYFPRVVEPDVFERVQAMAGARKDVRGRKSAVVANLVSGLCVCEHCGEKMEYRRGRKAGAVVSRDGAPGETIKADTGSLVCPKAQQKLAEDNPAYCDNRRYIAYLGFERALLDSCLHLAMDDGAFAQHDVIAQLNVQIADLRRDADVATKKAEALWTAWANPNEGQKPSAMALKLAQAAEGEADALTSQIEELEIQRRKAGGEATAVEQMSRLTAIRDGLYAEDLVERGEARSKVATAMRAIIDKIICQNDGSSIVRFKHGLRMVRLIPGIGRRPASFVAVDVAKEGEAYEGKDRPVIERFMQRRASSKA